MKRLTIIKSIISICTLAITISCTNLDEEVLDGVTLSEGGALNSTALLQTAYEGLRDFQDQGMTFTMNEMSTDALVGPTRGGDWDDNAKWRQFHVQTWTSDNQEILKAWNSLLKNVYTCTLVVDNSTVASEKNQARFLRAFYYYNVLDLFGQVPYRESGSRLEDDPKVWTRVQATAFVISELEAVVNAIPARVAGDPSIVNADAAHFLLAKLYLNKAVYNAASPSGPYTFDAADMNKVVSNVDAISSSLATTYWENFAPSNNTSPELLFTSKNIKGGNGGNMQSRWRMGMHYNQTPDGWNGFTTIAEYYNKFNPNDVRIKYSTPSIITNFGNPIGFQVGQMYKPGGTAIARDRIKTIANPLGQPLIYTPALTIITKGSTLESAGIRGMKYEPDAADLGKPENDYVLMRYSDALLMKAEANLRGASGGAGAATTILTQIATRAGQPVSPSTLDGVYLERGKELWWEGWRRNDMIRFGKFLNARELKPSVSNSKYALYPIPADALFNANLTQNPGY
jgi:starch-binding outer membrane protein, SusD/RagB family